MNPSPRTSSSRNRTSEPRWSRLLLIWATLGASALGVVLELTLATFSPLGAALLLVIAFDLTVLVTSGRRQRWLVSTAPYVYTGLLLVGWLYAFYFVYPSRLAQNLILITSFVLPTLYAQLFNRFRGPQALLQASGMLGAFLLLSVPHALTSVGDGGLFDGLFFPLVFGLSQALLLAFIASAAWRGGELKQVRQDAAWFQRLAHHDFLTGLPNRRQVEEVLVTTILQANRSGESCAVLMLDIDHFKRLNDTFGHPAGDEVLRSVAQRLRNELRAGNTLGRWGGEEFIVVAPQTDLRSAQQLGERLRHAVKAEPSLEEHLLTISVGIGVYRPGDSAESLVSRADEALYRAKQTGRDRTEA